MIRENSTGPRLLTTPEAARCLGLATGTLQNWRSQGVGPKFVRLRRAVRYDAAVLEEFIRQNQTIVPSN